MTIAVHRARTDDERQAVYRFRYRLAEEAGLLPPDADRDAKRIRDPLDLVSEMYVLKDGGQLVGSLRVSYFDEAPDPAALVARYEMGPALRDLPREAICVVSRFLLDPKFRNGAAVFKLMDGMWRDAAGRGLRLAYADVIPNLVPFYEHLGFRRYTRSYIDSPHGFQVPMVMVVRDVLRFERVHSPLARLVEEGDDDIEARGWFGRNYPEYPSMESAAFLEDGVFFDVLAERVASAPLHGAALLRGMDAAEAERFLADVPTVKAAPGDRIVRQGDRSDALYVLRSGVAELTLDESPDSPVRVLGAGDSFGEIGLLTAEPRAANVTARAPCEALSLSGDFLQGYIVKDPPVAAKALLNLSRILAMRLALTTRRALAKPR